MRLTAKVDKRNESLQLLLESAESLEGPRAAVPAAEPPPQMDLEGRGDLLLGGPSEHDTSAPPPDDAPHPAERGEAPPASVPAIAELPDDGMPISVMPTALTRPRKVQAESASTIASAPGSGTLAMFT